MPKISKKTFTHPTVQLAAATLLFLLSVHLSRAADMHTWEINLFEWVYGWPDALKPFFQVVTQLGTIYTFFALIIAFYFLRRYNAVVRILLTGLLAYLAAGFSKDIWGRARPHEILPDVVNLDYIVRGPGFPSGHTALVTALAFVVGRYIPPKFRWILALIVVLVGVSRVYLGIHAPLDIVGGFAIGWGAYALFCYVRIYNASPRKRSKSPRDAKNI